MTASGARWSAGSGSAAGPRCGERPHIGRPGTFDVTVERVEGRIGVLGSIPVLFSDDEIPDPSNGFAVLKDNGLLVFVPVFERARPGPAPSPSAPPESHRSARGRGVPRVRRWDPDGCGTVRPMSVAELLAASPGLYVGPGGGLESGPFVARITVTSLPNGGVALDYDAASRDQGVLHREHSVLSPGPDGCDRLYVAHSESPFVTEMVASEPGSSRFVQPTPFGPFTMEIVIHVPEPDHITYAWWWAPDGDSPIEQSKAETRRHTP